MCVLLRKDARVISTLGLHLRSGRIYVRVASTLGSNLRSGRIYARVLSRLKSDVHLGQIYARVASTLGSYLGSDQNQAQVRSTLGSYLCCGFIYSWVRSIVRSDLRSGQIYVSTSCGWRKLGKFRVGPVGGVMTHRAAANLAVIGVFMSFSTELLTSPAVHVSLRSANTANKKSPAGIPPQKPRKHFRTRLSDNLQTIL